MNEPDVTWGGPDGRRLLAVGSHVVAAAALTALAALASWMACGRPGAAVAAAAPSVRPDAAAITTIARRQDTPRRGRAFTGTPRADGSGPRHSRPPSPATPRSCPRPGR